MTSSYNLRSSSTNQSFIIEVQKSPSSQNDAETPFTPIRTPRSLPKTPSINDPEYIERLKLLERELAEIRINNMNITTENLILKDRLNDLEDDNYDMSKTLVTLEKELNRLNQYGRRENIELSGIPTNIPQEKLEHVVIDILRYIHGCFKPWICGILGKTDVLISPTISGKVLIVVQNSDSDH